jgi:hypothetical protein
MPRGRIKLYEHLHDDHGMRWTSMPSPFDLQMDHVEAHASNRPDHRHEWGSEGVRPA